MMEINEFEAGMLDAVLEAFAGADQLDRKQILELFGGDEELAAVIVDVLADVGLVIKNGQETAFGLPEFIIRDSAAIPFLKEGGFSAQVEFKEEQHGQTVEPMLLPDEAEIVPESIIPLQNEDEERIDELQPQKEQFVEKQPVAPVTPAPSKQTREVIFEVEFPQADEPFTEPEKPLDESLVTEEDPSTNYITAAVEEEPEEEELPGLSEIPAEPEVFIDEIEPEDEEDEIEPEEDIITEPEVKLTELPVEIPQPVAIAQPDAKAPEQNTMSQHIAGPSAEEFESLQQELSRLRRDYDRMEHKLREKDAMIHTVESHNEQLGKIKTFIWILLGFIALLLIILIFRSK